MSRVATLLALLGLVGSCLGQHDEAMVPGGSGDDLVESICERIEASCIFPDDKLLLRRVSYVESQDGLDEDTYRDGYHGGVWQVDQAFFDQTQTMTARFVLFNYIKEIQDIFGIDWPSLVWDDCRKPLVSALAARMYIHYNSRNDRNGIPRDIPGQADFWEQYYRTGGDKQDFVDKCNALETGCQSTHGADMVFVLDGSGSIGRSNFEEIKSFVKDVVSAFEIGPYKVGVIRYSTDVTTEFHLKDYATKEQILDAVDNIPYNGGGTNTHLALRELVDDAFLESNGARPKTSGVPRVGIVLTDGRSNEPSQTVMEALRAHDAGITMMAIGVGDSLDMNELEAIASEPICLHLFLLEDFTEVDDLKYVIEKRTCEAPVIVEPGHNGTDTGGRIPPGDNFNCQIKIPGGGATISLTTLAGLHSTLFLAQGTYPSNVFYEEKLDSNVQVPGVVYIRNPDTDPNSEWIIFCNIIGNNGTETNISFGIRPGDTTHCHSDPCQHGQCIELCDGYRCECDEGWTGPTCDTPIDPCLSHPCVHGTCTPGDDGGYTCTCDDGYQGEHCDEEIPNPCEPNPCKHGTCTPGDGGGYTCACDEGYQGEHCDEEIPNPCEPNPCKHGQCTPGEGDHYTCQCDEGYQGEHCDQEIPTPCEPNPCKHGQCTPGEGDHYTCLCDEGYQGEHCDQEIPTPCEPNPCKHGQCTPGEGDHYTCLCDEGYQGEHCDQEIPTPCEPNPCIHGQCTPGEGDHYTCLCDEGYQGEHCDQAKPKPPPETKPPPTVGPPVTVTPSKPPPETKPPSTVGPPVTFEPTKPPCGAEPTGTVGPPVTFTPSKPPPETKPPGTVGPPVTFTSDKPPPETKPPGTVGPPVTFTPSKPPPKKKKVPTATLR